jgi:protein-S-isoprenylcysteine O-methyltransferase Ste14
MYLAVGLVLLGEALLFESLPLLAYASLIGMLFHLFVVFYEEPTLKRKFGAEYEAYCRAVPRWLPRT